MTRYECVWISQLGLSRRSHEHSICLSLNTWAGGSTGTVVPDRSDVEVPVLYLQRFCHLDLNSSVFRTDIFFNKTLQIVDELGFYQTVIKDVLQNVRYWSITRVLSFCATSLDSYQCRNAWSTFCLSSEASVSIFSNPSCSLWVHAVLCKAVHRRDVERMTACVILRRCLLVWEACAFLVVADWLTDWLLRWLFCCPADEGNSRWKASDLSGESCANMMQSLLLVYLSLVSASVARLNTWGEAQTGADACN